MHSKPSASYPSCSTRHRTSVGRRTSDNEQAPRPAQNAAFKQPDDDRAKGTPRRSSAALQSGGVFFFVERLFFEVFVILVVEVDVVFLFFVLFIGHGSLLVELNIDAEVTKL